jgi:LytS/YehU family sensor histidine kinase
MGYRRDATYELQTDNIPNDVKIPPLIFHTLIENGVTHSLKPKECGIFRIKYNKGNNLKEFIIQNNGSNLEKLKGQLSIFLEEGLGYKYIRSRLEEKYSNQWGLTYGINGAICETKIKIYS